MASGWTTSSTRPSNGKSSAPTRGTTAPRVPTGKQPWTACAAMDSCAAPGKKRSGPSAATGGKLTMNGASTSPSKSRATAVNDEAVVALAEARWCASRLAEYLDHRVGCPARLYEDCTCGLSGL